MNSRQFADQVVTIAQKMGYMIETNRDGLTQINFGNKKLHADHLRKLFPQILEQDANIAQVIEKIAPGRPCTHRPMKKNNCANQSILQQ